MDAKTLGNMPASPVINALGAPEDYPGLTKREFFAGMIFAHGWNPSLPTEMVAKAATVGADALLAELAKGTE